MISECIMSCQIFENLVKITLFHLLHISNCEKNENFSLNFQDTYLPAFIKKIKFLFYLPKYLAILSGPYCKAFTKVWKTQFNSLENGADLKF